MRSSLEFRRFVGIVAIFATIPSNFGRNLTVVTTERPDGTRDVKADVARAMDELFGPPIDPQDIVEETPEEAQPDPAVPFEFHRTHAWG